MQDLEAACAAHLLKEVTEPHAFVQLEHYKVTLMLMALDYVLFPKELGSGTYDNIEKNTTCEKQPLNVVKVLNIIEFNRLTCRVSLL